MQSLGTKNGATSWNKKNNATFRDKKSCNLFRQNKITQPLGTTTIMQILRTKKSRNFLGQNKSRNLSRQKLDQETWLCRTHLMTFYLNFDYFRPYKNHVEPGYKGNATELMVNLFKDHLGR